MIIPQYIYPPRAEVKIPAEDLYKFDDGTFYAQPKYNGSCCVIYLYGNGKCETWNRHKEHIKVFKANVSPIHRGNGTMVIAGEYLNKNQLGEYQQDLNHKFVIWDILAHDSKWLVGMTTEERLMLLENLYPCQRAVVNTDGLEMYNHLCCTEHEDVYKTPTYLHSFKTLYDELVKTPLYEGLVIKKKDAKLEYAFGEKNNTNWQLKCRKETKNYSF